MLRAVGSRCGALHRPQQVRERNGRDAQGQSRLAHRRRSHGLRHLFDGFRPGGINRRGTVPPYLPDTLDNYEVGWKTSWLDNRFRWNGALFYEQWNNFQYSVLGLNSFTEIHNAGQAVIKGVETDVDWLVDDHLSIAGPRPPSTPILRRRCAVLWDPVTEQNVTVCPGPLDPNPPWAPANTQMPVTPKYKGNITARYQWNMDDFLVHLQGSLSGQSSSWADLRVEAPNPVTGVETPIRAALGKQPGFAQVDLTAESNGIRGTPRSLSKTCSTSVATSSISRCARHKCASTKSTRPR